MARRPNKDINVPSMQELIRLNLGDQQDEKPVDFVASGINGLNLQDTVLKRKQAQEDRVKTIQEKIQNELDKKQYQRKASQSNPDIANEIGYIPEKSAESVLKSKLNAQSDEAKLARAQLKGQAPDKIKQLFQVGDKVMGVTYGGNVQPIEVPGDKQLNPLKKTLPADASTQLGDFDTLSSQLERVKATKKPEYTGALDSRTGALAQTVDLPSVGLGASPERSDFYSNINSIRNQLLYLRSGKQINEQEYKRLLQELPDEHRSDVDFDAKLANFETVFNEIKGNRRNALATGYNVPGSTTPPPATGNPGGLDPVKAARLAELRAKKANGTLGR